jgi:hypothetical protein
MYVVHPVYIDTIIQTNYTNDAYSIAYSARQRRSS